MTKTKLYGLDHLRALAILLVLAFHYQRQFSHPAWANWFMKIGWTGVDLFYVLSGFLISSQLFVQIKKANGFSLRDFFIKRFFRILPLYFFIVVAYFLFPFVREKEALPPLWKFLTFTLNFNLENQNLGTFSHAWSLCVEEHFYLFLPLILTLLLASNLFSKSYWILISLIVLGLAIRFYLWNVYYPEGTIGDTSLSYWFKNFYYPTYNRLDGLIIGVTVAAIYQFLPRTWQWVSKFGNQVILLGLSVLTWAYFYCSQLTANATSTYGFLVIAIAYGFIVLGAICPTSFLYKWNSKTTSFIALLSYGLYLSHKSVMHMVQVILGDRLLLDSNAMMAICFLMCFAVAWLLNIIIEKPSLKLRDKVLLRLHATDANKRVVGGKKIVLQ